MSSLTDILTLPKVIIPVERRRLSRAQSQSFHLIEPREPQNNYFVLGSSGNQYIISVSSQGLSCSCPDGNKYCKHILFLLHISGIVRATDRCVVLYPSKLFSSIWQNPKRIRVKKAVLDRHTNYLCTVKKNSPCLWCRRDTNYAGGTIVICSKCGYLGHDRCFRNEYTPGSTCPRCCRPFFALRSTINGGYRNYSKVLLHFDYIISNPTCSYQSGSSARFCQQFAEPQLPVHQPPAHPLFQPMPNLLPDPMSTLSSNIVPASPATQESSVNNQMPQPPYNL